MQHKSVSMPITAALLGTLLAFGGIGSLATGFGIPGVSPWALLLGCLLTAAVFALCIYLRLGLVPLCAGALLLGYLWNRVGLGNSFQTLLFFISDLFNRGYGWGVLEPGGELTAPSLAVYILGCLQTALLTALLMWKKGGWLSMSAGIVPLGCCMILTDTVPAPWALAAVFLSTVLLLLTQHVRNRDLRQSNRLTAMLALPVAGAVLLLFLAFPQETYRGQELAQRLEDWVLSLFQEPEEEAPKPDPLIYPLVGGDDPVLNCVDLTAVGPKEESWAMVLKVTAHETGYLYLRGNAYNYYTGTTWMHNGVGVQWPEEQFDRTGRLKELEITTLQTHGILYSTYNPTLDPKPTAGRIVNSKRVRSYTVKYLQQPEFEEDWAQLIDHTLLAYEDPAALVTCLKLPTEASNWASDVLHDFEWYAGNRQYNAHGARALAHEIAEYVSLSTPYSLDTRAMPGDETDFASWFMRESASGYCVHFATAAAVLLRQAGIPARYVTGYLVQAQAEKSVSVRQKDAHAWVEYFVPGIGWMPLEATPGYYERVNNLQATEPEETTAPTQQETNPPTQPETTAPTQPSQTTAPTVQTTVPNSDPPREEAQTHPVLLLLLLLLAAALLLAQWRLRVWLWSRRKRRGSVNRKMLLRWREAKRLCRVEKTVPPEEIRLLALEARFGPGQMPVRSLGTMDRFLSERKQQLRAHPWYKQLYYTLILAIY